MAKKTNFLTKFYSLKSLYQLFLLSAFPFHVWAFLMAFRDFGWVAARTNVWDAVGLVSYALVFALFESVVFFVFLLVLGLLVSRQWDLNTRTVLIGTMGLLVGTWSVLCQAYYLLPSFPQSMIDFLARIGHPLRILWGVAFPIAAASVIVPAVLILKLDKAKSAFLSLYERIILLSAFYMLFDVAGIIVIIIRNLHL